ncbi:MAG: sigma-70 family RNA polymerase sigma factor, partial [Planctomycetota bacterium]
MGTEKEIEIREKMTRRWLSAETAVRAFVAAAVGKMADREDVVQQTALTVARRFEEYDDSRPFLAWVLWLAKSRVIDHYRSRSKLPQPLSEQLLDSLASKLVERGEQIAPRAEALEHCLEQLPNRSRQLIRSKYHEGQRIEQIAQSIRSTPASVRVTLFRIRESLAECIERRLAME